MWGWHCYRSTWTRTDYFTSLPIHIIASLQESRNEDDFSSYVAGNTLVNSGWPRAAQRWRRASSASSKETLIFWSTFKPCLLFFVNHVSLLPSQYINSLTFITVSLRDWQIRNLTNYHHTSQWNHLYSHVTTTCVASHRQLSSDSNVVKVPRVQCAQLHV